MGAPGREHEERRSVLDALAVLAGFETPAEFPYWRPDVHRRRASDGAWFVGEAKATEHPGDPAVVGRLATYLDGCRWCRASALVVLSVPLGAAAGWGRALASELGDGGPVASSVLGHSALFWTSYPPAVGHIGSSGQSRHFGLSGRHVSRPCWSALTW